MLSRRSFTLAVGSLLIAGLAILVVQAQGANEGPASLVGKAAPDFTLQTLGGEQVKLSEQKGNVVVLDFWATWCPPCRKSLPNLQAINDNKDLAEEGLKVYAVNAREDQDKIEAFMKQNNYTFAVPMDKQGNVMKNYHVSGIPTTVIVGRDGKVKNAFVGFGGEASEKQLKEAIQAALKEEAKPQA